MKRPPYLIRTKTRHGTECYYVWRRPGPRIRIRGEYGSRAFMAAYRAALYGEPQPKQTPTEAPETLGAMVYAYRRSHAWLRLADATRKQRGNMLDRILATSGNLPAREIDRALVAKGRDAMSGPGAAKCFIDTLRGLFRWAVEAGHVDDDPTQGVNVQETKAEGFHTWTAAEIADYENKWPVGSRERLWLAILIYTGMRRSDAVALHISQIRGSFLTFNTRKTGTLVTIPLHPELKAVIDASPLGKDTLIGLGWDAFGKAFRKACDEAGVKGSAHGLRKAAATRLAEAGASVM